MEGGERVYVDDRTGQTYVVSDEKPEEAAAAAAGDHQGDHPRQRGRLSRRLSDSMAWLDGLTDEQYDEYMVSADVARFPVVAVSAVAHPQSLLYCHQQ